MASISHILSFEATNLSSIHLHQDGIFWRAYERSAYLFVEHTKSQYKLTKRYIKLVNQSVVSLGFPLDSLSKNFSESDITYIDPKHICITLTDNELEFDTYTAWHASIDIHTTEAKTTNPQTASALDLITHVHLYEPAPLDALAIGEAAILDRLLSFRTEQSTAIDCLVFLSDLQRDLIALRNAFSD